MTPAISRERLSALFEAIPVAENQMELEAALWSVASTGRWPASYMEFFSGSGGRLRLIYEFFQLEKAVSVDPGESILFREEFKANMGGVGNWAHLRVDPARDARPQAIIKFVADEGSMDLIFIDARYRSEEQVKRMLELAYIYASPRGTILISGAKSLDEMECERIVDDSRLLSLGIGLIYL